MTKRLLCTIDNHRFSSMDALLKHVQMNYVLEEETEGTVLSVLEVFQALCPSAQIHVNENENKVFVKIENGSSISWDFYIAEKMDDNEFRVYFSSLLEAKTFYQGMFDSAKAIQQHLTETYGVTDFEVIQYWDGENYGTRDVTIRYSFCVGEQTFQEEYQFQPMDEYLKRLSGHFLSSIEGECHHDYETFQSSHTTYVDHVNVMDLIRRAKKVRIEILE